MLPLEAELGTGDLIAEAGFLYCVYPIDGFDETEDTVFSDILTETAKIQEYIQKNFGGHICEAYGCSMSGSFVGLLIQRKKVHIDSRYPG